MSLLSLILPEGSDMRPSPFRFFNVPSKAGNVVAEEKAPAIQYPAPTWQLNWQGTPSAINLRLLHGLLESGHANLTHAKGKDLVLFLGLSGAGKSTTVNYLKGCEMECDINESGDEYLKPIVGNQAYVKMGSSVESETLFPNIVPFSGSQLFVDCPGFEDNRGREYQICTKVATQCVIKWGASVKVVVVINYNEISGRAASFQRLICELRQVFNDLNTVSPSVLFLVNKAPANLTPRHVINVIKQVKATCEKTLQNQQVPKPPLDREPSAVDDISDQLAFLDLMLLHAHNILLINPLDCGISRDLILERLSVFTAVSPQYFSLSIVRSDQDEFNKLLTLLFRKGATLLNEVQNRREQVQYSVVRKRVLELQLERNQAARNEISTQLRQLDRDIDFTQRNRAELATELSALDSEEPVVCWEKTLTVPPNKKLMFLLSGFALGAAVGTAATGGVLAVAAASGAAGAMAAGGAVGAAAAGGAAAAAGDDDLLLAALKKITGPEKIEYRGTPYARAHAETNTRGWLIVKDDRPQAGVYSAEFYGNPFYTSVATVTIKLSKKNIPENAQRINRLKAEISTAGEKHDSLRRTRLTHINSLEQLEAEADLIKRDIERSMNEGRLGSAGFRPLPSANKWEKLMDDELQKPLDRLYHKQLIALKTDLTALNIKLCAAEKQLQPEQPFMSFLDHIASFVHPQHPDGVFFRNTYHAGAEAIVAEAAQAAMAEEKFSVVQRPVSTQYDLCLMSANVKIKEGVIYVNLIEEEDGSDCLAYAVIAPNGERVDDRIALNQLGLQPEQVKPFDIKRFKQLPEIINKIINITLKRGHTSPAWKVNYWQSNINLRLLHGLLEAEHTTLTRAKKKDLILLLGLSGAGKSTTVNYLKNCEMESYFTETGEEHLKPLEGNQTYAKMGCTVESETLAPNIIPLSGSQYFADCPGFEDNRGKEYQICAKITTQSVIRWSNSVKVAVVLINYYEFVGRMASWQRLARELNQVFNNLDAISPSLLFLVNRAPKHLKPQVVIDKIKQLKTLSEKKLKNCQLVENPDNKQKEELAEIIAQLTFFDLMLAHSDNVMMVNPLDGGASRELIMRRLATFRPINRQQFNLPTHNNDHLEFNKLLELLFEKGTRLLTQVKDLRKAIADEASKYQQSKRQQLEAKLRAVEQEVKHSWSFMDFLSGVADFMKLPQGKIFNTLFREIRLPKFEPQLLEASSDRDDVPPPPPPSDDLPPPPPPYEVNEAKGDNGRSTAVPRYGSVFNQGASGNKPNVPPKHGI